MVSNSNEWGFSVKDKLFVVILPCFLFLSEPVVTKFASRHFYADATAFCLGFCVEMPNRQSHVVLLAERFHESLVAIGLLASQMEVAMQGVKSVTQFLQDEQKRSGVGSATESNKHKGMRFQPNLLLNVCADPF